MSLDTSSVGTHFQVQMSVPRRINVKSTIPLKCSFVKKCKWTTYIRPRTTETYYFDGILIPVYVQETRAWSLGASRQIEYTLGRWNFAARKKKPHYTRRRLESWCTTLIEDRCTWRISTACNSHDQHQLADENIFTPTRSNFFPTFCERSARALSTTDTKNT